MTIDLDKPDFTLKEAAEFTSADFKTVDNYVMHKHVEPSKIEGRRLFSAKQLVEIELIARLASLFRIPPSVGKVIAAKVLRETPDYAFSHGFSREHDGQVSIRRLDSGAVHILEPGETADDSIDLIIPVQTFGRAVLGKAMAARGAE